MKSNTFSRRDFVKSSLYGLALASLPNVPAFSQTLRPRVSWDTFKTSPNYLSFYNAIGKMRRNTNANDPASWQYWVNVHVNYCTHSVPYFFVWHRGYLYYFEQQLRLVSGNNTLMLPYWDYYANPNLPAEFTNPSSTNPLYVNRVNTNVFQALTMAPFSNLLTNFPRGTANAFEPSFEGKPHNPVHDIIGGSMATMQSPLDPIFYLHHANIDRYWNAWVAADNGRQMPAATSSYWTGSLRYAAKVTMSRSSTINTRTKMGYYYDKETFPTTLPRSAISDFEPVQLAIAGGIGELAMLDLGSGESNAKLAPPRPPLRQFSLSGARMTGTSRRSIGGVTEVRLDENSVSAKIPLENSDQQRLQNIFQKTKSQPFGQVQNGAEPYNSIQVVLDNVSVTELGKKGGFFYNVYLNLPENDPAAPDEKYLLGTVGPFQIAGATHHGNLARLSFPATQLLKYIAPADVKELTVSFVRISGDSSPKGQTLVLGETRIELSADDVE